MKKIITLALLISLCAILLLNNKTKCWLFDCKNQHSSKYHSGKVISGYAKVIDGDSLEINHKQIRLHNIDAPEWNQSCTKDEEEYNCGADATSYMKQLTQNNIVTCTVLETGFYGRFLSSCINEMNQNLGIEMIRSGWAIPYYNDSEYYQFQQEAKTAKRGIWQGEFITPKLYRKLNPH
jgi:endonuclease YncB( thermonuclease family)